MIRFIIIRFLQSIFAFFGIIILVFFLIRLSGNPVLFSMSPLSTPEQMKLLCNISSDWIDHIGTSSLFMSTVWRTVILAHHLLKECL